MRYLIYFIIVLFINSCGYTIPKVSKRIEQAKSLAYPLKHTVYQDSFFSLFSFQKTSQCIDTMRVYIEGDGLAWITPVLISKNPTPINPIGLKLMLKDDYNCKIYLARPCQYIMSQNCDKRYWTNYRFSKEVIDVYIRILNKLKKIYNISSFELIGYSGGGTIATLLSAKRNDVTKLITVAGNLDTDFWTQKHFISPLTGSLNPIYFSNQLSRIKQIHLIGGKDTIIDKSIFNSYLSHFKNKKNIHNLIFNNYTHSCCWSKSWNKILKQIDNIIGKINEKRSN